MISMAEHKSPFQPLNWGENCPVQHVFDNNQYTISTGQRAIHEVFS